MPTLHDDRLVESAPSRDADEGPQVLVNQQRTTETDSLLGQVAGEFFERLSQGERPDVEEFARRYPQIAPLIRQALPALQLLGDSHDGTVAVSERDVSPHEPLGDYRLLREIGRGGMGVVYEAEQLSLKRKVALKVLPFAAVFDPRHVQRFKNEALAAAQLDHPHIVNVYGVGCERNVHFYAMRYIEGETLARVIEQLRRGTDLSKTPPAAVNDPLAATVVMGDPPTAKAPPVGPARPAMPLAAFSTNGSATGREFFRAAATLGRDVARALDYAHERGIVHRDIKPSNLMLDAEGKAWVTDFGLAHIESDVSLTMSGDLLGTLRYMSPEQVLAKRVVIDHRTDVYSLGVTLYELLTLHPAYPETDRHELIRRISFEDPRPPRQINPHIPRELETIVLKAMEKNPNERYETAEDLAEDFQRFLDNEPIKARRATARQRITKWSLRHTALVWSAAAILLVSTLALTVSTALIYSAYDRENEAREQALENSGQSHVEAGIGPMIA